MATGKWDLWVDYDMTPGCGMHGFFEVHEQR
jgi:hypothetical protein